MIPYQHLFPEFALWAGFLLKTSQLALNTSFSLLTNRDNTALCCTMPPRTVWCILRNGVLSDTGAYQDSDGSSQMNNKGESCLKISTPPGNSRSRSLFFPGALDPLLYNKFGNKCQKNWLRNNNGACVHIFSHAAACFTRPPAVHKPAA